MCACRYDEINLNVGCPSGQFLCCMLDLSYRFTSCVAVVGIVYWPSNPRASVIQARSASMVTKARSASMVTKARSASMGATVPCVLYLYYIIFNSRQDSIMGAWQDNIIQCSAPCLLYVIELIIDSFRPGQRQWVLRRRSHARARDRPTHLCSGAGGRAGGTGNREAPPRGRRGRLLGGPRGVCQHCVSTASQ